MKALGQTPLVLAFANAIAQEESGGNPNALSYRNNNPGNLVSWGSNPIVSGFAHFPTLAAGWAALYSQIETNIARGLTTYEFFAGKPGVYAGYASSGSSASNNPTAYANFVAQQVGIDPSIPLNQIDPSTLASTAAPATTTVTIPCDPSSDPTCTGTDPYGNPCDPNSDPNCPGSQLGGSGGTSGIGTGETIALVAIIALAVWFLWE